MNREIILRFLAEPMHINFGGKVHGGTVMKWIDQAGYTCAVRWSGQYCVTAYVGNMKFYKPIHIGNLVEVKAKIAYTGRTSMHIFVEVSSGVPEKEKLNCNTRCIITFVALNKDGEKIKIPKWYPGNKKDIELENYAKNIIDLNKKMEIKK